jgi:hypothetical protein
MQLEKGRVVLGFDLIPFGVEAGTHANLGPDSAG